MELGLLVGVFLGLGAIEEEGLVLLFGDLNELGGGNDLVYWFVLWLEWFVMS